MNERMALPKQWFRFASYVIRRHIDIARAKKIGKIVDHLLEIQKYHFSPAEIAAVITADHNRTPSWLHKADELLNLIDEERRAVVFPAQLPLPQRSVWLKMVLANTLAKRIREITKEPA